MSHFFLKKKEVFLLVNCQTNWGFPEEWHSTWKWEFGALVHYVALTRLQSSSAGVSLGPLRVLNNASYSLSRELISGKLSNQHWRALKECWVQSDWRLFKKIYFIWTRKWVLASKLGHSNKETWQDDMKTRIQETPSKNAILIFAYIFKLISSFEDSFKSLEERNNLHHLN